MSTVRWPVTLVVLGLMSCSAVLRAEDAPYPSYRHERDFLATHTQVVELTGEGGARVAICPQLQGRVMTSTCDGLDGPSLGWINRAFFEAGKPNKVFNNFGGEDRFWLAPEAGQFGFWFAPGAKQELANWITPPGLNEGAFRLGSRENDPFIRLTRRVRLTNASETKFDLGVTRDVRLLTLNQFAEFFGQPAAQAARQGKLKNVGFETRNVITNRGEPMSTDTGLVSIWVLGMFHPGEQTVIIAPYRPGPETELGPVVESGYFGHLPPERLRVTSQAVLFLGDGQHRSKIGLSQQRARPVAGAIDFARGVLTLVHFSMPDKPTEHRYLNNLWELPQQEPYVGDVFNSYNDGPPEPDTKSLGGFYELETLSPARELAPNQSLTHHHRTFHFHGDLPALNKLAQAALGVDLDEVRTFVEK